MQFSNPDKMLVLMSLPDPFDFTAFREKCAEQRLAITGSLAEYAQKVGLVKMALLRYPDRTPFEAYMLFVSRPDVFTPIAFDPVGNPVEPRGCAGCGGGVVQ